MPDKEVSAHPQWQMDHFHANPKEAETCQHDSCVKRRNGLCGSFGCAERAVFRIMHRADVATLQANDAGAESVAKGLPVAGAKIERLRSMDVVIELACKDHVDGLLAGARYLLDDCEAVRIEPEAHGERRGRR